MKVDYSVTVVHSTCTRAFEQHSTGRVPAMIV